MDDIDKPAVRLCIVGTGGIGRLHAEVANEIDAVDLVGLASLDAEAQQLADGLQVPLVTDYRELLSYEPDVVLVATPNQTHLEIGRFFAESGVHLLVEKPIAESREAGKLLCDAARQAGVTLQVGHHRRYHRLVRAARDFVAHDAGRLVATNTLVTMRKPDSYYDVEWRRSASAGPLLVNLIHEVDLLRAVCGEIDRVQAVATSRNRDFAFDDTAALILHYANGAVGTLTISESATAPWSWESSVSDGMGFYNAGQDHAKFIGTEASLSFPSLTTWRYDEGEPDPGWQSPLVTSQLEAGGPNPYVAQLEHMAAVVRGVAEPIVSGEDGLRSLVVVDAVLLASASGAIVDVEKVLADT